MSLGTGIAGHDAGWRSRDREPGWKWEQSLLTVGAAGKGDESEIQELFSCGVLLHGRRKGTLMFLTCALQQEGQARGRVAAVWNPRVECVAQKCSEKKQSGEKATSSGEDRRVSSVVELSDS